MSTTAEVWTTIGLLDHIENVDKRIEERAFAFILGAGASKPANIPTSKELVLRWLDELQRRLDPQYEINDLAQWATAENLDIPGFEFAKAAAFYPEVFNRRFRDDPHEGYAYLSDITEDKTPNIGYLILAQLLTRTRHRVAITTNLDNLIAQAMALYARSYPLAVTPAALTKLARPRLRRPLLVKLHEDPLTASQEQVENANQWAQPLYRLFEYYTPIVIGYDEDDGGVIDLLNQIEPCDANGGIFWCYDEEKGRPNGRIEEFVSRRRGKFVPIPPFDQFMQQLGELFSLPPVADEIERLGQEVAQTYRQHHEPIHGRAKTAEAGRDIHSAAQKTASKERTSTTQKKEPGAEKEIEPEPMPVTHQISRQENCHPGSAPASITARVTPDQPAQLKVISTTADASAPITLADEAPAATAPEKPRPVEPVTHDSPQRQPDWNEWLKKIEQTHDIGSKESLYREAIENYPDNATIFGNFAYFMESEKREPEKAEALYRQAIKLDGKHTVNINRYANFMAYVRKSYDTAERLYQRAIELDPNDAMSYVNYAGYLIVINNLPKALEYTKRAWVLKREGEDQTTAQIIYYRVLIAMATQQGTKTAIGRLKALLKSEPTKTNWNANAVISAMRYKLAPEKYTMIEMLAEILQKGGDVSRLDKFSDWREVEAIPLSEPWGV